MASMDVTGHKLVPLLASALGTAVGLGISYFTLIADLATLTERMASLQTEVQRGIDDRYRGSDAIRDFALVNQQIKQNAHQIEELEKMMREHVNVDRHPRNDP